MLATITDKKFGVPSDTNSSFTGYYEPEIIGAFGYYPFGAMSRIYASNEHAYYRFGFNGKELDHEAKGSSNQYDYGERAYDPRIGRFNSVDPISKDYPELSSYQYASNRPIDGVDQDGLEWELSTTKNLLSQQGLQIERAEQLKNQPLFIRDNAPIRYYQWVPPPGSLSDYQKIQQRTANERNWQEAGLQKDGSKGFLLRVAENKTWNKFADNLALPMIEGYGYLSGAAEIKGLFKGIMALAEGGEVKIMSEFLGGAKGELYSKQNILEANHLPTMNSYSRAGFNISYNEGSAYQMLYDEHRAFISTGKSAEAVAFRKQEAELLLQGKYLEAFDLNAKKVVEAYGTKYNNAINQARQHFIQDIIPKLQQQALKKTP